MNSRKIIIFIIFAILAVFFAFVYIYIKQIMPKYKWNETYSCKSKEPYGSKLLYEMLKKNIVKGDFNTINKSIEKQLPLNDYASNYFFIGNYIQEDTAEIQHLLKYVEKGNKAFIFTNSVPEYLMKQLTNRRFEYDYFEDSIVGVYYPDDTNTLYFKHRFLKHNAYHYWHCIERNYFYDSLKVFHNFTPLSFIDSNYVNYYAAKYGKGTFYFNTLPILFTN